jgi:hypothetical protein
LHIRQRDVEAFSRVSEPGDSDVGYIEKTHLALVRRYVPDPWVLVINLLRGQRNQFLVLNDRPADFEVSEELCGLVASEGGLERCEQSWRVLD